MVEETSHPIGKFYSFAPTYTVSLEALRDDPATHLMKVGGMLIGNVDLLTETVSLHKRISFEEHQVQMGGLRNALEDAAKASEEGW